MFAVIIYKGKQYKVTPDQEIKIDLIETDKKSIVFSDVLIVDNDKEIKTGAPTVEGATVEGEIVGNAKDKKVTGIKFHAKKRYKRTLGHRQDYTIVKIKNIKS
jgi:large subunit ribosomal protein L21